MPDRAGTSPASTERLIAFCIFIGAVVGPDHLFWRGLAVAAFLVLLSISHELFAARTDRGA